MKVWPVKHSPLLCQPERFIARNELQALIQKVTHNLVNIKDESGQFLLRLDDGRVIDTKGWNGWEWTHGVGLYGIYQYYQQTGDTAMRDIIDGWFADRFAEGATTKNVNTMAPFLTLAYRYEETGNPAYLPWLDSWAEWAMNEMPRTESGGMQHITLAEENHQQMWDDTLMMTVLPLAKIGKSDSRHRAEYLSARGAAANVVRYRHGFESGFLSRHSADVDAVWPGDGDPVPDGVSAEVFLRRAEFPRSRLRLPGL